MNPDGVGRKAYGRVDVSHYRDLVAHGGLVNALRVTAEEDRVDGMSIDAPYRGDDVGYTAAKIDTCRGRILVHLGAEERCFLLNVHDENLWIAGGGTADLSSVLAVAVAWRDGISLESLESRFPFMRVSDLARVLASPDPISAQWNYLREAPVFHGDWYLVNAAFENPVLRSFFPDLSHGALFLSRSWGDRRDAVKITPRSDGGYSVSRPSRFESLDEAIIAAATLVVQIPE